MRVIFASLIILLGIAYTQVIGWYPDVEWLNQPLGNFGWPLLVVITGIGILVVNRGIFARDTSLKGWAAFSLCGCLLILPLLIAKNAQEHIDEIQDGFVVAEREALQAELRREAQAALNAAREARLNRPRDRFTQYEGRVDLLSLESIRNLDLKMQASLKERSQAYQAALEKNPTRSPDAWLTAASMDELESELTAHQRIYEAARGYTQFVEAFEETYTSEITALDLKPPADRIAIAEMQRVLLFADENQVYELRKLDVELIGSSIAALTILRDEWGNWSFDRREQRLFFDDPAREAAFHAALKRLVNASEAARELNEPNQPEN